MFARMIGLMSVCALLVSFGLVTVVHAQDAATATGTWKSGDATLHLTQDGETLTGTWVAADGTETAIADGSAKEGVVSFTAGASHYSGKLAGDVIAGTATTDGNEAAWEAHRATE